MWVLWNMVGLLRVGGVAVWGLLKSGSLFVWVMWVRGFFEQPQHPLTFRNEIGYNNLNFLSLLDETAFRATSLRLTGVALSVAKGLILRFFASLRMR